MPEVLWDTSMVIEPVPTEDYVTVSIVTVLELASGVNVARGTERALRLARYTAVLQQMTPLPLDVAVASAFTAVDAAVRAAGRAPRGRFADLQIAATALAHRLPLVTRNPKDFHGLTALMEIRTP